MSIFNFFFYYNLHSFAVIKCHFLTTNAKKKKKKRCEEYNVFSYAFGSKKKALSDILASQFILK